MKISTSCTRCRAGKRKCIVERGDLPCKQCLRQNKYCSFTNSPRKQTHLLPKLSTTGRENDTELSHFITPAPQKELAETLIDLYLNLIHDKPHTLFSPSVLRRRVRDGTLPRAILYGIMALSARFSDDPEVRQKTKEFFSAAKISLKMDIDNVCLDNIHASILVGNLCGAEGETAGEALFFGVAFRMAHVLHLPEPDATDDGITQEIKVRTWWSLYMIDTWSSAGLNLPRQMYDKGQNRLPMPETSFWSLGTGHNLENGAQLGVGLWGYMVILARIFSHIQDLHVRLADGALDEHQAEAITERLAHEFDKYLHDLPSNLHFTVDNLKQHATAGLGRAFVALHLGYHHYATLLYFQYFDTQLQRTPSRTIFVARCKYHAASFSDLLKLSHETEDCEAFYLIVAHMTVVSSSALLHTLLFGSQDELLDTRKRLYLNFEILLKLKQFWPGVDLMMERLFTFQKVCMQSMDDVYTVDRWIVKFLLHHALPIEGEVGTPTGSDLAERGRFANDALSMLRPVE